MVMKYKINDHGTVRKLQKTAARIGKLEVPHKRIAAFLDQWVNRNFQQDGGLLSDGKWVPFVHGGRVTERGIDNSAKLLRDTSALLHGFNTFYSKRTAGIGNTIPYAEDHEEGKGFTPQRRMLPREDEVIDDIINIYEDYIQEVSP